MRLKERHNSTPPLESTFPTLFHTAPPPPIYLSLLYPYQLPHSRSSSARQLVIISCRLIVFCCRPFSCPGSPITRNWKCINGTWVYNGNIIIYDEELGWIVANVVIIGNATIQSQAQVNISVGSTIVARGCLQIDGGSLTLKNVTDLESLGQEGGIGVLSSSCTSGQFSSIQVEAEGSNCAEYELLLHHHYHHHHHQTASRLAKSIPIHQNQFYAGFAVL